MISVVCPDLCPPIFNIASTTASFPDGNDQIGHCFAPVIAPASGQPHHYTANGPSTILGSSSKSKPRPHFTHCTDCLPISSAGLSGTTSKWISWGVLQCGHLIGFRLTVVAPIFAFYHPPCKHCGVRQATLGTARE